MTQIFNNSNNPTSHNQPPAHIKFLYSYAGKIIPRPDGKLRYVGGHTRVLSIESSITFAELIIRFGELCGESMTLRCKLPTEELDMLVSIKSDEDLMNVIKEYESFSLSFQQEMKIRAILSPSKSVKKVASPPSSPMSCFDFQLAAPSNGKPPLSPASANRWRNEFSALRHRHYQNQNQKQLYYYNLKGQFSQ